MKRALQLVAPFAARRAIAPSHPMLQTMHVRGAKMSASEIRAGDIIEYGDDKVLWRVMTAQFVRQGQGRAYMQVEMKNVKLGHKKDVRLRSEDEIEKVELGRAQKMQVLFWDKENISLMEQETFEQSELPVDILGDQLQYLQEGMIVQVESHGGQPLSIQLPKTMVDEMASVEGLPPGSKTDNRDISGVTKSGIRMRVPKFIKAGDRIVIDTRDGKYLGKEQKE